MMTTVENLSLTGRVALVTGVSRPAGIGHSVALRMHQMGATVFATGWPTHDSEMPWGESPPDLPFVAAKHDLANAAAPAILVDEVIDQHGRLDIVIAVHARSSDQSLESVSAQELDDSWATNVRSIVLLAQAFARVHEGSSGEGAPIGRMLWFTSGQHLGPMENTLAYSVSKGALHQMTQTLDRALSKYGIVANCINPGPVDTGWAPAGTHSELEAAFPDRRWGQASDVANLVAFLVRDEGSWIRGQVLNSEGGFDRFA